MRFLRNDELPEDKEEARKVKIRASRYLFISNTLYKRSFILLLLRCLFEEEADYVLREIHGGVYRSQTMAHIVIQAKYYWPSMQKDTALLAHKCDKCQRFVNVPKIPVEELVPIAGS